ncbi:MAG: hypothetical protein M9930_19910 [Anaerolineae bacterium]|nr:hypothetical protein [Anaerolineae bacterium]
MSASLVSQVLVGNAVNGEPPDPFGLVNWLPLPSVQLPGLLCATAASADLPDCAGRTIGRAVTIRQRDDMTVVAQRSAYDITVRRQLDAMGAYVVWAAWYFADTPSPAFV